MLPWQKAMLTFQLRALAQLLLTLAEPFRRMFWLTKEHADIEAPLLTTAKSICTRIFPVSKKISTLKWDLCCRSSWSKSILFSFNKHNQHWRALDQGGCILTLFILSQKPYNILQKENSICKKRVILKYLGMKISKLLWLFRNCHSN